MSADAPAWPPVTLAHTQLRRVQAGANGRSYRISLWLPPGAPPPGGWPLVCVLDANALFATFVEALRRSSRRPDATGIGAAAVVGIAHDGDALYAGALRERDFTWGAPADDPARAPAGVGGGPAFLDLVTEELLPSLRREFGFDAGRQALFGHSLAGHFVLRALAERPTAFRDWIAISPSIWWDPAGLRARLAATLPANPRPRVFIGVGEWEGELPPWQRARPDHAELAARRAGRRMVEHAQALAAELAGWLPEGHAQFRCFPEEDHASVLMVGTQRALRFIGNAAPGG